MEIETKYAVGLFFSNPTFVQIYFEAIANAFDAGAAEVTINISFEGQIKPDHFEITITDDGEGFTDERFDSFARLKKPADPYHKGLGRLVYLHYFKQVLIESFFGEHRRNFTFSEAFNGDADAKPVSGVDGQGTTLRFRDFTGEQLKTYDNIRPQHLKDKILEHFLPLLYEKKKSGTDFTITVNLDIEKYDNKKDVFPDSQSITPEDIPNFKSSTFTDKSIDLFKEIKASYILQEKASKKPSLTAVCIDGRTIPVKLLPATAIPTDYSAIFLFESEMFAGKSDSSRQRLILPDSISESSLNRALRDQMSTILNDEIPVIKERNTRTRQGFEDRYPHLTGFFEEDTVGLIDRDEAIGIAQQRFFAKQKEVLDSKSLDEATFKKSLDVSSRTLTVYILYRELIIKKLGEMTAANTEADIHNIIVPQRRSFQGDSLVDGVYSNNAWILDDKFMSFRKILSEAKMREVVSAITLNEESTGGGGDGRPDLTMIFSADPDEEESVDVVVVELKRRAANVKENMYASTQLIQRAQNLADFCPNVQRIWYFAIIEIDDDLARLLSSEGWTELFSLGRLFFRDFPVKQKDGGSVPTPVYLVSYDAVIKDAAARNHTFLELLKSDIKASKVKN